MLDLDRYDAWTERSHALRAGARRRMLLRLLATVMIVLAFVALWPAKTPAPARATTTPHGYMIQMAQRAIDLERQHQEAVQAPNRLKCMLCEYEILLLCIAYRDMMWNLYRVTIHC